MENVPQLQRAKSKDIRDLLTKPSTLAVMKALATRHLTPERLTRLATISLQKTPKLAECDAETLLGAFLGCQALGLEPNTPLQHIHLIPFENRKKNIVEVQVIIGYRGYLELGRRSGLIVGAHADVVYPGDLFEHQYGTETFLRHQSRDFDGKANEYTHAYCHVALKDGQAFAVMPKSAILRIRDGSQGFKMAKGAAQRGNQWVLDGNPWVAHEDRMARKTAIRRLFSGGEVPLSLEMAGAVEIDERRVDFAALSSASAEEIKENLGGFAQDDDGAEYEEVDADGVVTKPTAVRIEHQPEQEMAPVEQEDAAPKKMAVPRARGGNSTDAPPNEDIFR